MYRLSTVTTVKATATLTSSTAQLPSQKPRVTLVARTRESMNATDSASRLSTFVEANAAVATPAAVPTATNV